MARYAATRFLEFLRFELTYQLGRARTWLLLGLFMFPLFGVLADRLVAARAASALYNAPLRIVEDGLLLGMVGLLVAAVVAGDAATRDIRSRLEPLMHAAPISKVAYIGGRFGAVFLFMAGLMAVVVAAHVTTPLLQREIASEVLGPARPIAYVQLYVLLLLPNAFIAGAVLFALPVLVRHAAASFAGVGFIFLMSQASYGVVGELLGWWKLAIALDPLGFTPVEYLVRSWPPGDLDQRLIGPDPALLLSRALWLMIALMLLALAVRRLDFGAREGVTSRWWQRGPLRPRASRAPAGHSAELETRAPVRPIAPPSPDRSFGFRTRMLQLRYVTWDSMREIAPRWSWPAAPALVALQAAMTVGAVAIAGGGTPVVPTTAVVLTTLGPGAGDAPPPAVLAALLLPIILAGELVWRERDAGVDSFVDSAPVTDAALWVGKLLALWLVMAALFALMALGGMVAQVSLGVYDLEPLLYARALGLRVLMLLVFCLFAMAVHAVVNQKYVGHVIVLALVVAPRILAESTGVDHPMLVPGQAPAVGFSDVSGFGPSLGAHLWLHLYWASWAAVVATGAWLLWARGQDGSFGRKVRGAVSSWGRRESLVAATTGGVLVATSGFVLYNTNVLHEYRTPEALETRRAAYERLFGSFRDTDHPVVVATDLDVDLYPQRRSAEISGVHRLVNRTGRPIDTVHVATSLQGETDALAFDRPTRTVLVDDTLGHQIHLLETPLMPGDTITMEWNVRHNPRGFSARGVSAAVVENGSFLVAQEWVPLVGYQPTRELVDRRARTAHGLPERVAFPSLYDPRAPRDRLGMDQLDLRVTVSTALDQIAVAPGILVRDWSEGGRAHFRYETDAPIGPGYAIFSAEYEVAKSQRGSVDIEILHHPGHDRNVPQMLRSIEASLENFTARFGPFPYRVLRMVEYPSRGGSLHAASATVWYGELFSHFDSERGSSPIDMPFAVVAHEVAHQFQPVPARMEGRVLLSESFAWYAAMGVIEQELGPEQLQRLLVFMRRSYLRPRSRADVPLLRARDSFQGYRKGPFAMYALREYVGQPQVDLAWRRLRARHASHEPPFATSLDLHRELLDVTPDSLHPLVNDLVERNTWWELSATSASAARSTEGGWDVTLELAARKVVVDTLGGEAEQPMADLVEIGVFAEGGTLPTADALHLSLHRIRTGVQTIQVRVDHRPSSAGVDPRHLLIETTRSDNVVRVTLPPHQED